MVSPADAERLRKAQQGVRALILRDLTRFWSYVDLSKPERARNALLEYVPLLVRQYGESAGALAADWYDEMRAAEGVPGRFRALVADSPYEDAVEGTVRRAAGPLFIEGRQGEALESLAATLPKYVLASSRQTIAYSTSQDPRASGWQRVVRGGACGFCRMLHGRGAVYKRDTAHFAAHKSCNCAAVPSWDRNAPEVDVRLYEASKRTTAMSPEEKARHNALIHRAVDQYT